MLIFPRYPDRTRLLLTEIRRVVRPGGRVVCRLFATPEETEPLNHLREETYRGAIGNFHALKWRIAMAIVRSKGEPNIAVQTIRDNFMNLFPDRDELARQTGWPRVEIDTIDVYQGSAEHYAFPTRAQFVDAAAPIFSTARLVKAGAYPLAERCPLLILEEPK